MKESHAAHWENLGEFVVQIMEKEGVPGVGLGILHEGEVAAAGFGVTNVDHPLPVTDDTLFQIGSITKTYTGTAIMRLVEMGKLELDAPVRTYLPDFKVADETVSAQATIRHLITHMGGWEGDYFHGTGMGDDALARYVADMADLEQLAPLNSVWSYCNSGFSLAGRVIEVVTGKGYEAAMKELILEPLGLERSYFDPNEVMTYCFASGHDVENKEATVKRPWPLPRAINPAGGVICNIHDLLRYAAFHLGDGTVPDGAERLLDLETLATMQTEQVPISGDFRAGLSWGLIKFGGEEALFHTGGTVGQAAILALVPAHNLAVGVLTNAENGGAVHGAVVQKVVQAYLENKPPQQDEPKAFAYDRDDLAAYVGRYGRPFTDIELGMIGDKLIGVMTPKRGFPSEAIPPEPPPSPMSLGLFEKDLLQVLDGPFKGSAWDVVRKADGSVGWLRVGARIHAKVE